MIDAQKLLNQFLGTGQGSSGYGRPQGGSGRQQGGFTGRASTGESIQDGIGKLIGGALGGSGGRGSSGGFGGMGGAVPAALAGGVASYLLKNKRGRKLGGSAVKLGGLALIAGLGYKAWQNYQAQNAGASGQAIGRPQDQQGVQGALPRPVPAGEIPSAQGTRFQPAENEADARARLLLSAMIAAAKADGYIDREEEEAIFGRVDDLDLDAEEKGLLMDEMRRPMSLDDLVRQVKSQEVAVEVYLASLLAIDPDHPAEKAYLDLLAARLDLAPELVAEIRRTANEAQA